MKIFSLYVTRKNVVEALENECENLRYINAKHDEYEKSLTEINRDACLKLKEEKDKTIVLQEDVKELRSRLEDTKSANAELNERLEKEMSDNCELQNLYSEKCKECEALKTEIDIDNMTIDDLIQKKEALEEKLKSYDRDGYVVVKEDYLNKLKDVYEKKQAENETRNANRRKRRADKKASSEKQS